MFQRRQQEEEGRVVICLFFALIAQDFLYHCFTRYCIVVIYLYSSLFALMDDKVAVHDFFAKA
jgi:hypothetical protein